MAGVVMGSLYLRGETMPLHDRISELSRLYPNVPLVDVVRAITAYDLAKHSLHSARAMDEAANAETDRRLRQSLRIRAGLRRRDAALASGTFDRLLPCVIRESGLRLFWSEFRHGASCPGCNQIHPKEHLAGDCADRFARAFSDCVENA